MYLKNFVHAGKYSSVVITLYIRKMAKSLYHLHIITFTILHVCSKYLYPADICISLWYSKILP